MITLPPVLVGATQVIVNALAVPVAATAVGANGTEVALTIIAAEAAETNEVVVLPDGVTVNVYESPFVSPLTVQL